MDHTATISLNEHNKLNYFKKILLACLVLIIALVSVLMVYQHTILSELEPILPMDDGKSPAYYKDFYELGVFELIWAGVVIFIALLLYGYPGLSHYFQKIEDFMIAKPRRFLYLVVGVFAVVSMVVALVVLQDFPNSSDEYVYLYQAETMSRGRLHDAAHPVEKSFDFNHIAIKDGLSVGRFPPGWPMVLAIFYVLNIPPVLANPLLAVLTLIIFYRLARKLYGDRIAGWSLLLLTFSSFFIFNSASYFSHPTCLFAAVLFVYCAYMFLDRNSIWYAVLAGACMGFIIISRYYTAVLIFLPFLVIFLYQHGIRALLLFVFMSFGALPFLGFLLWYNHAITGNALEPVTMWAYREEGLGFINDHTVLKGFEHIIRRFLMFIYWFTPVILFLYFFLLADKIKQKRLRLLVPEDYIFLMLVIGYFFYYEIGGNQYGPRFYYEALPFMILFVVAKVFREKKLWAQVLLYAALLISVVRMPFIAHREYLIIEERKDVYRLAEEKKVKDAIILLSSGTSVTRPMPSGDLTRNDRNYSNDILYAIDRPESNAKLMDFYKDRKFYKYYRNAGEKKGRLVRIR